LVEGSPSSIRAVANYLETDLGGGAREFAAVLPTAVDKIASAWEGLAGDACVDSLRTGHSSVVGINEHATARAGDVRWLADELEAVLATMANVRATARANGIRVAMTTLYRPSVHPQVPVGSVEFERYEGQMAVWRSATTTVASAKNRWERAVESFSDSWGDNSSSLVGLSNELFSTTATAAALANKAYRLVSQRNLLLNHLASAERSLSLVVDASGKPTVPSSRFYELVDEVDILKTGASTTDDLLKSGLRVGSRLAKGLWVLGIAGTGYAIYDDIQSGESVDQAVVSNVGGFLAGVGTGAAVGAIVGSFIVPPAGTIVGAVVGGIIGAGVGMFTSGAIDHLYENASAGLASTVEAGFQEIGDTFEAAGDLVSGAWDALFG
jgi:hypothetical protein